ncbi:DoxX family protein [Streptomyces sp. NPDC047061]|uniref:DoxX family protein n=1 Tax=Streptomyces sp. NPDC047061 TaxID=3154605 RepID=UPI0033D07AC4
MFIVTVILAVLLALAFLAAGLPKIAGQEKSVAQADHLGVPQGVNRGIGGLEVLGALGTVAGLWAAWLGVAAGVGLGLLMVGALGAHVRAKDPGKAVAPATVFGLLAVAYVVLRAATA